MERSAFMSREECLKCLDMGIVRIKIVEIKVNFERIENTSEKSFLPKWKECRFVFLIELDHIFDLEGQFICEFTVRKFHADTDNLMFHRRGVRRNFVGPGHGGGSVNGANNLIETNNRINDNQTEKSEKRRWKSREPEEEIVSL
jgi:hypothetical protein